VRTGERLRDDGGVAAAGKVDELVYGADV
jgi:hypothetical protein